MSKMASQVSQKTLAAAVDKAVRLASERHELELDTNLFGRDLIRTPPWIVGRVIRGEVSLDQAYVTAEAIARGVEIDGVDLQPVALKINKDILVGFIERFGDLRVSDIAGGGGPLQG